MPTERRIYQAFGELLYVIAMKDGYIQPEESDAIKDLVKDFKWSEEIEWSFNYEEQNQGDVDFLYKRAIEIFKDFGPHEVYEDFIKAMQIVAEANNSTDEEEEEMMGDFVETLITKFKEDLMVLK